MPDTHTAKGVSLIGQIVGAIWIGGWNAFQFLFKILHGQSVDVNDIVYSGIAVVACFSPVYVSILLDKIKALRFGDTVKEKEDCVTS